MQYYHDIIAVQKYMLGGKVGGQYTQHSLNPAKL